MSSQTPITDAGRPAGATTADAGRAAGPAAHAADASLRALAEERLGRVEEAVETFFGAEADAVSRVCWEMARRFHRGGRLLAFGEGAAATDALHVSVEFVHPVLVGKRALPALALEDDPVRELTLLARPDDMALAVDGGPGGETLWTTLGRAGERGLLTVALLGDDPPEGTPGPDHLFVIHEDDPTVVQEIQETLYHVLWELVHVFFDHGGLLR